MDDVTGGGHPRRSGARGPCTLRPATTLTSFVGRRQTVERLVGDLRANRLVSVTGPGGVGKTRTAVAVAGAADHPDGVVLVELASVTDPTQVAPAVATALRVPDQSNRDAVDRIVDHLAGAAALLVIDNCEHLLEAGARLVLRLLEDLPDLTILTTSREPLGIRGERVHLLAPLAVPEKTEGLGSAGIEHVPAVQLLLDRARAVLPDFAVTPENRQAVVALCRRLDGLPLAIELAAVRLRSMSVSQVVDRLDRRFHLLGGSDPAADPRQRSLRALIDWSHDLCGPDERLLWARISVFPAAVDLETLEGVCTFGELTKDRLLDALDGLVGKSVVVADRDGERVRYRQFVTLREYGSDLLAGTAEADEVRRRHRDHFTDRARISVERWCGPHQAADLGRLREDHPNLIAALAWSAATPGEVRAGARLASLLRYHWIAGGFLTYGRRWTERLLDGLDPGSGERGEALWAVAWVALIQGDAPTARSYLDESAGIADQLQDTVMQGHVAHWRGLMNLFEGDLDAAEGFFHRGIGLHRSVGDEGSALAASFMLAMAQAYGGRPSEALQTCAGVVERASATGELWNRAYAHWVAAICHLHLDDLPRARASIAETIRIEQDFRDGVCTALSIEVCSWIVAASGRTADAAALSGIAGAVWHRIGTSLQAFGPHAASEGRHRASLIDERLGASCAAAVRAEYGQVGVPEAVRLGIEITDGAADGETARPQPGSRSPRTSSPLTNREQQIAQLIADGMSNRDIATELTISVRTVDGHVERILRKLDFGSRTQVASWMAAAARARS